MTDSAIQEQDIVFVRVCVVGKIAVSFLGIENTPKADAEGVTASIVRAVEVSLDTTMPVFNKKVVSIATDGGASVMTGRRAGVVALLRENQPALLGVHCFAHRLELACRDVISRHPAYGGFDRFLLDVFLFYHNRPTVCILYFIFLIYLKY